MTSPESYDAVLKALMMMKRLKRLEGTLLINEGVLLHADTLLLESQEKAFVREVNALISQYRNAGRPLGRAMLGFDGGNVMIFHAKPFVLCLVYGNVDDTGKVEAAGDEFMQRWSDSLGIKYKEPALRQKVEESPDKEKDSEAPDSRVHSVTAPLVPVSKSVAKAKVPVVIESEPAENVTVEGGRSDPSSISEVEDPELVQEPGGEDPMTTWLHYRAAVENLLSKVLGRGQSRRFLERELSSIGITGDSYLKQNQFRPFGQKLTLRVKDKAIRKQLDAELLTILEKFSD